MAIYDVNTTHPIQNKEQIADRSSRIDLLGTWRMRHCSSPTADAFH
jgi:hypothetical protein